MIGRQRGKAETAELAGSGDALQQQAVWKQQQGAVAPVDTAEGVEANLIGAGEVGGMVLVAAEQRLILGADVQLVGGADSGRIEELPGFAKQYLQSIRLLGILEAVGFSVGQRSDLLLLRSRRIETGV